MNANGFLRAPLALAKSANSRIICRIHRKMKSADSANRQNLPLAEKLHCLLYRFADFNRSPLCRAKCTRGPQTAQPLGWAWKRRFEGSSYSVWQSGHMCKYRHRCTWPVIRDRADNRITRAAIGAVDKRITIAPILGVEQLARAIIARRKVGRDQGHGETIVVALNDLEMNLPCPGSIELDSRESDPRLLAAVLSQVEKQTRYIAAISVPSTSMMTPLGPFMTCPPNPSPVAILYTNGRNPTPCTTPLTWYRTRTRVVLAIPVPTIHWLSLLSSRVTCWRKPLVPAIKPFAGATGEFQTLVNCPLIESACLRLSPSRTPSCQADRSY